MKIIKTKIALILLLFTITFITVSCGGNHVIEQEEPTKFELLTKDLWTGVNAIEYNDEEDVIGTENITHIGYLFLTNKDLLIYDDTYPEGIRKWSFEENETKLKEITYQDDPEVIIYNIETLTETDLIFKWQSEPAAVIQTSKIIAFRRE